MLFLREMGLPSQDFHFHPGQASGDKSQQGGCAPAKINEAVVAAVHPVRDADHYGFPVPQVRNPDPGIEGNSIACSRQIPLAESVPVRRPAAVKFVRVKAGCSVLGSRVFILENKFLDKETVE
jgi:hypothetical protein